MNENNYSFDYRNGYFKALLDVKNYFDSHSETLKNNKIYNSKKIPKLLQLFIDNCEKMMMYGDEIELIFPRDTKKKDDGKEAQQHG